VISAKWKPRKANVLRCGPFVGIRDSLDPLVSNDPTRARMIQNMLPLELDKPSTFVGRPGFDQAGSQLGASAKRTGQLVCQFTKLDGTEYTVAIVGGQGIYTYDWSTEAWTQVVTVANLTSESITLSETSHIYAVTFANNLVISDGVNTPWMWDGQSGTAGLTSLTAAPVFYGQPVVYYAKLFAIKNTERNVIVWSEEQDATIGYETTPYSNSWQLGQTDQEGIYALAATNEALYYLRARSAGAIRGAVTPEFTADGTHEGLSQSVGTQSPDGVVVVGERVFFIDADARPHVIQGGQLVPLFDDLRETIRSLDRAQLAEAITRYDPTSGLVLIGVVETGQSNPSAFLCYNPTLMVPCSVWRGYTYHAVGIVKNADAVPVMMHLSADGYAYDHGTLSGALWDDELNAATQAIAHALDGPHLGVDARNEKRWTRADVLLRAEQDLTAINFKHKTPYGTSSAIAGSVESSEPRYGTAVYGTATWGTGIVERHLPFGLNGLGRWMRPRLDHQVIGERFGVTHISVEYTPAGDAVQAA
jgi:hypothetical protein